MLSWLLLGKLGSGSSNGRGGCEGAVDAGFEHGVSACGGGFERSILGQVVFDNAA